jgi:transcriptional regulator with GAF, ATPase, and Fis domain
MDGARGSSFEGCQIGRARPACQSHQARAAINEALEKTRYNRTAAAKLLGITFRAMRYRMERLGIK